MESFNSLFKRLDWVVVNCSSKCQEEVYFLKKIVSEVKLRDKIEDAYLFLFFQELKFNLVQDNELLEMINNNHDLLATKKWKFNDISFDFLKSMSKYNAAKKDWNGNPF
ncbi:hypothetical protein [Spiroplasma endosymbiont of Panzeria rudis]|uniref:hypothetical protein n=1 Tax=Spiroplasma endosymbiont of Panzeria rudis TaxID=3066301 RepID=UPI0030D4DDC7